MPPSSTQELLSEQGDVIKMNNIGVGYIIQGRYNKAISILLKVLGIVRTSLEKVPSSRPRNHDRVAWSSTTDAGSRYESVPGFCYPSSPSTTTALPLHHQSETLGHYVFSYPIAIPEDVVDQKLMIKANSISIMYNLALAFHLRGKTKEELTKAISLYQLCHRMLVNDAN